MQQFKLPAFLIASLFSVTSFAQQTKIEVQRGQKFNIETSSKVNSVAEVMGQSMENNSDVKTTSLIDISASGQDGVVLKSTVIKMLVEASAMGQTMNFDSEKKNNEGMLADALNKVVNKPRNIILDTKGTIVKQDETEEGPGMIGAGATGNETTTELFIPALIGRELKVGDSFTDIGIVKKEKYDSRDSGTYKVTAIENGIASISYTGTQVLTMEMEQMGMEMINTSTNVVKIELQMDINTGLVLAKASVIEATVSIEAGGMTIPATGKTITTVKITPVQ
jgi:hypothetical protein